MCDGFLVLFFSLLKEESPKIPHFSLQNFHPPKTPTANFLTAQPIILARPPVLSLNMIWVISRSPLPRKPRAEKGINITQVYYQVVLSLSDFFSSVESFDLLS